MCDKIKIRDIIICIFVMVLGIHYLFTEEIASLILGVMWCITLKLEIIHDDIKELRGTINESKKSN